MLCRPAQLDGYKLLVKNYNYLLFFMNKKILYSIFIVLIAAGALVGFLYKNSIVTTYNTATENLQNFQKSDLSKSIQSIAKQILAPGPLNIGGQANNVVLTKTKIIAQTNFQRFDNGGLPPLIENAKLNAAALAKANDIFKNQYFEHVSPSGIDPGTLVKSNGYSYILSGENLILGNFSSEKELVQAWMDSPGHRANILNNRFTDIGVAIIKGTYKGDTVWVGVQEFGLPLSACDSPSEILKQEIEGYKATLDNLSSKIEAKRQEINNTSPKSPQYNALVDQYNSLVNQYNQLNQTAKSSIAQYNNQVNSFNQCVAGE
jgi:uncharacterized protein YkwD